MIPQSRNSLLASSAKVEKLGSNVPGKETSGNIANKLLPPSPLLLGII